MKKIIILLVLAMALFSNLSSSCAGWLLYHKPTYRGKIVDAETKKPIEGAVVVAVYRKQTLISGPGGGYSTIIKIRETLTDEKGEYYIPTYFTIIQPLSIEDDVNFIIFKAGYGSVTQSLYDSMFVVSATPEGLFFLHGASKAIWNRFVEKKKMEFEEWKKTLPEEQRVRLVFGLGARYLPFIPMENAKERLQSLNVPFFTIPDDIDIDTLNWYRSEEGKRLKIEYQVIGIAKLNTWEERRKTNRIDISTIEWRWPLLHEAIKKEEEWLDHNKGWRRKQK